MAKLTDVMASAIEPALALLPHALDSATARVLLLAIGLQESRLKYRRQVNGPARGLWQFERGGGVHGVLSHSASRPHALAVCKARGVGPSDEAVYLRLAEDDVLAAAFARLLLFTDPAALPALGQGAAAWNYYYRNWRPGRPHPEAWPRHYEAALQEVYACRC